MALGSMRVGRSHPLLGPRGRRGLAPEVRKTGWQWHTRLGLVRPPLLPIVSETMSSSIIARQL